MIRMEIAGDSFIDLTDEIVDDARAPLVEMATKASDVMLERVKRALHTRVSQPSTEGEAPAYQSGELWRSFSRMATRVRGLFVQGGIKSTLSFEEVNSVEYGHVTKGGRHVGPRPFIRPTEDAMSGDVQQIAETVL